MADENVKNPAPRTQPGLAAGAATAFVPPPMEEVAALLPEFQFLSLIGVGGMSVVYLARQTSSGGLVAIKVMPPPYEDQIEDAERFIREAETMSRLVHPHIVAVFECGQTSEGHLFLVMEYVEGADLHRVIRSGKVNAGNAYGLIDQLCDAVQYAHDQGVAHRDIKPANILITTDGQVKMADFGLARDLADTTVADDGYGTPDYAAPERYIAGAVVDHRADIYSLGVVIHEMLTGETPRQAARHGGAKLPDAFTGVMSKCLMIDPARRYQSAREVKSALSLAIIEEQEALTTEEDSPPAALLQPVPLQKPVDLHRRPRPWLAEIGWALACVAAIAVIGWFEWQRRHPHADGSLPSLADALRLLLQWMRSAAQAP
jgi:serine/threonine protein kinase